MPTIITEELYSGINLQRVKCRLLLNNSLAGIHDVFVTKATAIGNINGEFCIKLGHQYNLFSRLFKLHSYY